MLVGHPRLTDLIPRISKGSYILLSILVVETLYANKPNASQPRMIRMLLQERSAVANAYVKWDALDREFRPEKSALLTFNDPSTLFDACGAFASG